MAYPIEVNLIPVLPKKPYNGGVGKYKGVIAHATANDNASADGHRTYETTTWKSGFAHFFVDHIKILQVADVNYVGYGAGSTANYSGYVHVELCQTTDPAKFAVTYPKYVWLLAKILYNRKLPVVDNVTLMSHAQVSVKWKETDHTDPIAYLARFNKTWANVVADVKAEYLKLEGGNDVLKVAVVLFTKEDYWAEADVAAKNGNCAVFVRESDRSIPAEAMSAKQLIIIGGATIKHSNEILLSGDTKYQTAAAVAKYLG